MMTYQSDILKTTRVLFSNMSAEEASEVLGDIKTLIFIYEC